jgi:hypothetical protein
MKEFGSCLLSLSSSRLKKKSVSEESHVCYSVTNFVILTNVSLVSG